MYSSILFVFFLRSTFINVTPSIWELPVDAGPAGLGGDRGIRVNACWADGSGQTLYGYYFQRVKRLARMFCGVKSAPMCSERQEGVGGSKANRCGDFDKGTSVCVFFCYLCKI